MMLTCRSGAGPVRSPLVAIHQGAVQGGLRPVWECAGARLGSETSIGRGSSGRPLTVRHAARNLAPVTRPCRSAPCARQNVVDDSKRAAQQTASQAANKLDEETGLVRRAVAAHNRVMDGGVSLNSLLGQSLLVGLTFGTLFQATHNNGLLPVYDLWPFRVGPMLQAGIVPAVLAPIWLLYGYLQPWADEFFGRNSPRVSEANALASKLPFVALTWGALAMHFLLSDYLYLAGVPHWQISATLAALAFANYKAFDDTKGGLILGALLAVGAPAGEMFIVNVLGWWHYDRPDLLGVPHWAGWCYACYAWGVGNVGRYLVQKMRSSTKAQLE